MAGGIQEEGAGVRRRMSKVAAKRRAYMNTLVSSRHPLQTRTKGTTVKPRVA
jgi:hypothetical protein